MLEHEQQFIAQAQRGDTTAFGALYDHYVAPIYRFIYLKVAGKHTAEDLTHEVFLSAWQNIGAYNHKGYPFGSWLYQIARNKVIDHYRTRKNTIPIDDLPEETAQFAVANEATLDQMLDIEKVKLAIKALPERYQNVLIMRFVDDWTPVEIAEALGKSEGAVRLMQFRALKALKAVLDAQEQ